MTNNKTEACPVCGKVFKQGGVIFHMRKTQVFEIYEAYKNKTLERAMRGDISLIAPHEDYIQKNSKTTQVFEI